MLSHPLRVQVHIFFWKRTMEKNSQCKVQNLDYTVYIEAGTSLTLSLLDAPEFYFKVKKLL